MEDIEISESLTEIENALTQTETTQNDVLTMPLDSLTISDITGLIIAVIVVLLAFRGLFIRRK